jgi:acyl-CoA reductase-like NAD-dependent aldehyde dehydrogenase
MSEENPKKCWKASELRRLPPEERDAILEAAAAQAEADYRNDTALTAFEAFGKVDLSEWEPITPEVSEEELDRREQSNEKRYTTAEVLERLKEL